MTIKRVSDEREEAVERIVEDVLEKYVPNTDDAEGLYRMRDMFVDEVREDSADIYVSLDMVDDYEPYELLQDYFLLAVKGISFIDASDVREKPLHSDQPYRRYEGIIEIEYGDDFDEIYGIKNLSERGKRMRYKSRRLRRRTGSRRTKMHYLTDGAGSSVKSSYRRRHRMKADVPTGYSWLDTTTRSVATYIAAFVEDFFGGEGKLLNINYFDNWRDVENPDSTVMIEISTRGAGKVITTDYAWDELMQYFKDAMADTGLDDELSYKNLSVDQEMLRLTLKQVN